MNQAPDDVRKKMADPFTLGGFIPETDRNGVKEVFIEHGTGRVTAKTRKEDTDAVLNKITKCPYTGIWRMPHVYAFFNTRILRNSNAMLADLENRPYGRRFNYQEFYKLPKEAGEAMDSQSNAGAAAVKTTPASGTSVADEKAALQAAGKYYEQGEGPRLEDLSDAYIGIDMLSITESGKEIKCSLIGADGYFETARCAVEFAMTVRFDYNKLPHKGGVLNSVVIGQECYANRIIASGPKWSMGSWLPESEHGPPGFGS